MKETEPKATYTNSVRELSHHILERHAGSILSINNNSLNNDLLPALQQFQNESGSYFDPFASEHLSPENELGLNLFLDVVNFCYQNPYNYEEYAFTNKDGKTFRRATGLMRAMAESGTNWGNFAEVARMRPERWSEIAQLDKNISFYLGAERGSRISGFARKLQNSGFINVSDLLICTEYDTELVLPILDHSGYFTDEFQKRSQLTVNMLNGVLKQRFGREMKGFDTLTVMADYRLPQVMYNFGTIELSPVLKEKLMRKETVDTDSPVEMSLRAATVVVGEKLSKLMKIPEGEVDSLLWSLSQKMSKEGRLTIPHMLVATDKY